MNFRTKYLGYKLFAFFFLPYLLEFFPTLSKLPFAKRVLEIKLKALLSNFEIELHGLIDSG